MVGEGVLLSKYELAPALMSSQEPPLFAQDL